MLSIDQDMDSAPRGDRLGDGEVRTMDRATYLGGTDAAAICGLHPYKTAHQVWLEKTGRAPAKETNLAMRIGLLAEPMLSTLYEETTGRALTMVAPLRHPKLAFIGGSPDRVVKDEPITVELKTANIRTADRWGETGSDEVPEEYLVQVAIYLALQDHDRADLAVLLGGSDFRVYHILRDRELEGELLERMARFWTDHVQADRPPEVDGSDGAAEMLKRIHHHGPEKLASTPAAEALVAEYAKARAAREGWEAKEKLARQRLESLIGNAGGVVTPAGVVTLSTCRGRVATNWEAIAKELEVPQTLVQKHTKFGADYPRFMFKPNKEK